MTVIEKIAGYSVPKKRDPPHIGSHHRKHQSQEIEGARGSITKSI